MPVYDQGYRPYEGALRTRFLRWWPITRRCLFTVRKKPLAAVLIAGGILLLYEVILVYATGVTERGFSRIVNPWGYGDGIFYDLLTRETYFVVLLLMVSGAGQIAEDVRTGALQIYFSKPITHADYVLGKLGAVVLSGCLLTLLPGALLFLACAAFSPDWSFLTGNPWLPLRILAFSLLISIVLGSLVLAVSSLGRKGRVAAIVFGGAYFFSMVLGEVLPRILADSRYEIVHLGRCLGAAGSTIFTQGDFPAGSPALAWGILASLSLVSVLLLARKVKAVEVVR